MFQRNQHEAQRLENPPRFQPGDAVECRNRKGKMRAVVSEAKLDRYVYSCENVVLRWFYRLSDANGYEVYEGEPSIQLWSEAEGQRQRNREMHKQAREQAQAQ